MNIDETSDIEEPSWSFCVNIDANKNQDAQESHGIVVVKALNERTPSPSKTDTPDAHNKGLFPQYLFQHLLNWTPNTHGRLTTDFLRNAHVARSFGWTLTLPLYLMLFWATDTHYGWSTLLVLLSVFFPPMTTWFALRSRSPLRVSQITQILETALTIVFVGLLQFDPVLLITALTIALTSTVISSGLRAGALNLGVAALVAICVHGNLRSPDNPVVLSPTLYVCITVYLLSYITLVSHRVRSMVFKHQKDRLLLRKRRQDIEELHQHLIETMVQPFVSADTILDQIRNELTPDQVEQYRQRIRSRQVYESIGRRAGGVAHDVKNLLQPILLIADMLEHDLQNDEDNLQMLEDMTAATQRAGELLKQLRHPTKETSDTRESCDFATVTQEAVRLLATSSSHYVAVQYKNKLPSDSVQIPISAMRLHQVIMNIGLNGIQAMDGVGVLEVHLQPFTPAEHDGPLPSHLYPDQCVTLSIRDTGTGISDEIVNRIFEPYFTTKGGRGGTGLGLATTQAIVNDAGGVIRVQSKTHVGTLFRVVFQAINTA